MDWGTRITYLASTALRDRTTPFGIKDNDRRQHVAILGRVGTGRAALMTRMALQDIERGIGIVAIDVAGNLGQLLLERLTDEEQQRVIHLDPSDAEYPFSWNIVDEFRGSALGKEIFHETLPSIYRTKKNKLTDIIADYILENKHCSVLDMFTLLTDEKERAAAFPEDHKQYDALADAMANAADTIADVSEHGRYLAKDTMVRNLLGQTEGKFVLSALSQGAIVIVDVSRVRIFPTRITPVIRLFTAAARAQAAAENIPVGIYLHDCLRYFSERDAELLLADRSSALTLSDTIYHEGDTELREKALARVGSVIAFEPHQLDMPMVEHLFYPSVTSDELATLEPGEMCVALTIDGVRSNPFFADSLPLPERQNISMQDILVESRQAYTTPRLRVDQGFTKKPEKGNQPPEGGPPAGGGGGSFTDAFRSIFTKGAAPGTPTAPDAKVAPGAKPPENTKAPAPAEPQEVSEDDLKNLLYVGPVPA